MAGRRLVLVVFGILLLMVGGASAVTFVINDGDASLSLAATPDEEIAFSLVVAKDPGSYSATMTADDGCGASAGQESSVGNADFIFSASAGIGPDGDYAYTFTETWEGCTQTAQEGQASQGNSASAAQNLTSIAAAGATVINATDSNGNTVSESVAFFLGVLDANLASTTSTSATASQGGVVAGGAANTLGLVKSINGAVTCNRANIAIGGMTYDNTGTAQDLITEASQNVTMAGVLGSAFTHSIDGTDTSDVGAGFILGTLDVTQESNTTASAHAMQSGTLCATLGNTWGQAVAGAERSWTAADVAVGTIDFDGNAIAGASTSASQTLTMIGAVGSASTGSTDGTNTTDTGTGFILGTLDVTQESNTTASTLAGQSGTLCAALGNAWGGAVSGTERSWTAADIAVGTMDFKNVAAAGVGTTVTQGVMMVGIDGIPAAAAGNTSAGSTDGTNTTEVGAGFLLGSLENTQTAMTLLGSQFSVQFGSMNTALGSTRGQATFGDTRSWTSAGIVAGNLTFYNSNAAHGSTTADQGLQIGGIDGSPVAGAGSVEAGSTDSTSIAEVGSEFILGVLSTFQHTDSSTFAYQDGTMEAALGSTYGEATFADNRSWTSAGVIVGNMTFDNSNIANEILNTIAEQNVHIGGAAGLPIAGAGSTEAGSTDGTNTAKLGTEFILGTLDVHQDTYTSASAYASQNGNVFAGYGRTWGEAVDAGSAMSWTNGTVVVGTMDFDTDAYAGSSTSASHELTILGLSGNATAGSTDGTNSTEIGVEIGGGDILAIDWAALDFSDLSSLISQVLTLGVGTISIEQNADTGASAHADQNGWVGALADGRTWGEATSGANRSWTSANVTTGYIYVTDNGVTAETSTSADQNFILGLTGQSGCTWVGSEDGTNYAKVGTGFNNGGILGMTQVTDTTSDTIAAQLGVVSSYGTTIGDAWTRTEAGNTSGRLAYVETKARWKSGLAPVSIMFDSRAVGSDTIADIDAYMLRLPASSTRTASITNAYASNGGLSTSVSQTWPVTNGFAWATDTLVSAGISM